MNFRLEQEIAFIREEQQKQRAELERRHRRCRHLHSDGSWAIRLVHNFPDLLTRGICMLCHDWINPREWACEGPNEVKLKDAHPLYQVVDRMLWMEHLLAIADEEYAQEIDGFLNKPDTFKNVKNAETEHFGRRADIIDKFKKETEHLKKTEPVR